MTRGFTLIEMVVIILVLLIIAAIVMPRIDSALKSQANHDIEGQIQRLPAQAIGYAVEKQVPVSIRISGTQLIMETAPAGGYSQTTTSGAVSSTSDTPVQIRTVDLGSAFQVDQVQLNGQPSSTGTWAWTAYPDGTADQGGIEFTEDGTSKSLEIKANGGSTFVEGTLPDVGLTRWQAGQLEQRT